MAVATDDVGSVYRTAHDRQRDGPITGTIVHALAAVEDVEPENLDVRLYDSVDGDAVERLYETARAHSEDLEIRFTIADYEVTVEGTGYVEVRGREAGTCPPRR